MRVEAVYTPGILTSSDYDDKLLIYTVKVHGPRFAVCEL
jgi:hypothetical protein